MSKKVKLFIILLALIIAVPITTVIAASKEGIWNGKDVKTNSYLWNGRTFSANNSTASIFNAMNSAKNKTESERFAWINSEPRDQKKAIWSLGADIYKEGVSCIGHRLAGWDGLCSIQVFDMYPNTTDWRWQTLARLIVDSVGKGEDSIQERRVVQWCYDHSSEFDILRQDKRDQSGSWGASYSFTEEEAKKMSVNKFESISTKDGKQEVTEKDGYTFIGPYNFTIMGGEISQITITTTDNREIKAQPNDEQIYVSIDGKTITKMNNIKAQNLAYTNYSGDNFYIVYKGKLNGVSKIKISRQKFGYRSRLVVVEAVGVNGQNLILFDGAPLEETTDLYLPKAGQAKGNLKIIKVNQNNEIVKLQNVGFKIQNSNTKKYVKINSNKEIIYVDKFEDAEEFMTDKNGEITIKNLIVGDYIAYETKNPNYGYEIIKDGIQTRVVIDKTEELKIPNKQKYIKLSGYVWVDRQTSKQDTRNNLYHDGEFDSNDMLLDGIKVRLIDKTTNKAVKEAITSNGGAYKFEDVLVDDLEKYYVEFEYDGLTYQNVTAKLDKNNGSKSAENSDTRVEFNNGFAFIEGETESTGVAKDVNGNVKHKLSYTRSENKAVLNKGDYPINATTEVTGYKIKDHYTAGQEEIKYINLGLYEREMPAITLRKDVENVELSINGYNHVYEYGSNQLDNYTMEKDSNGFNVGVRFANVFKGTYKRAVYQPDYNYTAQNPDSDSKLNVYITYRIAMYNESTNLKARVNSILDYYDKNLVLDKIGTGISKENGQITGDITKPQVESAGDYNKIVIQNNTQLDPGRSGSIYVRFKLKDEEVLKAINKENEKVTYINVAEVNSYSIFDRDGKVYAGIDRNSAPANATPGNETTYENDTERAPGIQLDVQGNRTLSGSVFLDEPTAENPGGTAKMRLGNGIYDISTEKGIEGVEVTLTENKQGGQVYTATTGTNGDFRISDFIPGNYTLTYTWGDTTYTVKDYKGTIWTRENRTEKEQSGNKWYKTNVETRYSDAMDNWETRQNIDAGQDIKMNSTTPEMALDLEVNSVYSVVPNVDKFVPEGYEIKHIDFGIIERARQQLEINKRVKTFKVTLANGQVIVDAEIDENGELKGNKNNLIYMRPGSTGAVNGRLWLQLDSELIQGAKVQVGYEINVINNSEKDYDSKEYYLYGDEVGNVITTTPTGVYDYLDGMTLDTEKNNGKWQVVSKEEYNRTYESPTIVEEYFNKNINSDSNTSIWKVASETYKEIYTEWAYSITENKTVRDTKLSNRAILHNEDLEKELIPGATNSVILNTSVILANSNEIDLNNSAEITRVDTRSGRIITPERSILFTIAPPITVTPPTGDNNNYILIIATTVSALVILGVGVILIKRKTL